MVEIGDTFKDAGWGYRHLQCFILFTTYIVAFSMKSCIGVALVARTKNNVSNMTAFQGDNASIEYEPEGIWNILMVVPPYPSFKWDKTVQETIIAAFYWGFMVLQVPAGQIAHKFGVRYMLAGTMAINSFVFIIFPMVTYYGGWYCTVVCRLLQGLSQACIAPGVHTLLGKWAPLQERGRLNTFVFGGQAFGVVLGLLLTGFISASDMGWPGLFRFYAVVAAIQTVIIWYLIYDTPAKHPKISLLEKKIIEDDVGKRAKCLPVPWLKIFCHKGIIAIVISQIATSWGNLTLFSEVPVYMDKIMKVDIRTNGVLSALPFLVMWFAGFLFSWLTDWLIIKRIMSVTNSRKFAKSLGYIPAGVGMIALAYAPLNIYVVETLLITVCAFKISAFSGFLVNHIDISPNYARTTISIGIFVANISTSLLPIVVGLILTDVEDIHLWRKVFCLTAGIYLVTNLIYVMLGTSDRADWNEPQDKEKENDVEESLPILQTALDNKKN